jgi:hypothetical protein
LPCFSNCNGKIEALHVVITQLTMNRAVATLAKRAALAAGPQVRHIFSSYGGIYFIMDGS